MYDYLCSTCGDMHPLSMDCPVQSAMNEGAPVTQQMLLDTMAALKRGTAPNVPVFHPDAVEV
jgi:hypothetical protein